MISTAKGLETITKWMIKAGVLEQFSRAAELLNDDEQNECEEISP